MDEIFYFNCVLISNYDFPKEIEICIVKWNENSLP